LDALRRTIAILACRVGRHSRAAFRIGPEIKYSECQRNRWSKS
jgi:hypothetical protein